MQEQPTLSSPPTADTRTRILDAAIDLFSIHGYSGVSIRALARAVGIKESSFYNHFPSKEALFEAVLQIVEREYAALMPPETLVEEALNRITPEQFFKNGFRSLRALMDTPRMEKLTRILTMEMYRSERARAILLENTIRGPALFSEKIFRQLIERGQIRAVDPALMAMELQAPIFTMMVEYLALHVSGQDISGVEQKISQHIDFIGELVRLKDGDAQ